MNHQHPRENHMSYSEQVLAAGANVLDGRNFEYKLGRNHFGIERDRIAAVRHILDVTLPLIAAETPLTYGETRSPESFNTTSDVGWGAF